jgi:hypothetical protein
MDKQMSAAQNIDVKIGGANRGRQFSAEHRVKLVAARVRIKQIRGMTCYQK